MGAAAVFRFFLSAAAFSIWYTLLRHNKAGGEITLYRFVIPISGSLLSALVLPGEDFTLSVLFALILVASGLIAVNYRGRKGGRPMAVYEKEIEVRYAETDQMGVVYHANYLVWFELGRSALLAAQGGLDYAGLEQQGFLSPVISVEASFFKPGPLRGGGGGD